MTWKGKMMVGDTGTTGLAMLDPRMVTMLVVSPDSRGLLMAGAVMSVLDHPEHVIVAAHSAAQGILEEGRILGCHPLVLGAYQVVLVGLECFAQPVVDAGFNAVLVTDTSDIPNVPSWVVDLLGQGESGDRPATSNAALGQAVRMWLDVLGPADYGSGVCFSELVRTLGRVFGPR